MRRFLFPAICILLISGVAAAQDFSRIEIFGGYSITNIGGGDIDDLLNYWNSGNSQAGVSVYTSTYFTKGFDASVALNLNKYFGIEGNFQYNTDNIAGFRIRDLEYSADGKQDADLFSFMAGPRFNLRSDEDLTPFAHFLVGINRVNFDYSLSCIADGAECPSGITDDIENSLLSGSDAGFGFAVGGGVDLDINETFAIRLIQAEYVKSYHEGDFSLGNTNISFGVVLKFGQK